MSKATEPLLAGTDMERQLVLEKSALRDGAIRYRRQVQATIRRGEGASLKPAEQFIHHWMNPMLEAIANEKRLYAKNQFGDRLHRSIYGPLLALLPSARIALATIHETLSMCLEDDCEFKKVAYAVGRAIIAEANYDLLHDKGVGKKYDEKPLAQLTLRVRNLNATKVNWWAKQELDDPIVSRKVTMLVGNCLLWLLIGCASAVDYDNDEFVLAFHHTVDRKNKRSKAYLHLDDRITNAINKGHEYRQYLRPRYYPMVVKPYPWSADAEGGYTSIRTPFITRSNPRQTDAMSDASLDRIHDALNAVNATPWRVNHDVWTVMRRIWDTGGGAAGVPRADDLPFPPQPDGVDELKKWKFEAARIFKRNKAEGTARLALLSKLDIANQLVDAERIWFPHQLDFRSRMYPVPLHLNHQGNDHARGLLQFAEARPLGDEGLRQLKIHTANMFGYDKATYDERVLWFGENIEAIRETAARPVDFDWWHQADKPFQFLAACMEVHDATPDSDSCLPVQVDGTCNGLQHYAAILRDSTSAGWVNLTPSDAPSDLYSHIAEKVAVQCEIDAGDGHPGARAATGFVTRQVVKRPVMTTVYGVTFIGANRQIRAELEAAGVTDRESLRHGSYYLAKVVMESIDEVFTSANLCMDWLQRCARLVAGKAKAYIQWTTPMGMIALQPYEARGDWYETATITARLRRLHGHQPPPRSNEHSNGIAPNWIHSLDASHMMMTAIECAKQNITFAGVHDCFWCHACDLPRLAGILRQKFVELHSTDLASAQHREWSQLYPQVDLPNPPARGDFDITQVLDSPYFFH